MDKLYVAMTNMTTYYFTGEPTHLNKFSTTLPGDPTDLVIQCPVPEQETLFGHGEVLHC